MGDGFLYKVRNIPVVYEDDWLLVVNKPTGLLSIPTPKNERYTLTAVLNGELKDKKISYRLHPCHRLDRETSGLIIYAKGKAMQKKIMELFKEKKIKKTYIAFIQGSLPNAKSAINYPLEKKPALTKYKIIDNRKEFSIVEVVPLTGRTNQIRLHFKYIGHPLVGETKYAFRRDFKLQAKRVCLHAKKIDFMHPITKKAVRLDIDLPQDLKLFLEQHK
jgi:23S rRNA pseudouridine1911/1915/1917 synthase